MYLFWMPITSILLTRHNKYIWAHFKGKWIVVRPHKFRENILVAYMWYANHHSVVSRSVVIRTSALFVGLHMAYCSSEPARGPCGKSMSSLQRISFITASYDTWCITDRLKLTGKTLKLPKQNRNVNKMSICETRKFWAESETVNSRQIYKIYEPWVNGEDDVFCPVRMSP